MAHTVELPTASVPRFPDRCVVCGRERPGDAVDLRAFFNAMQPLDDSVGKIHHVQVPACAGCKGKLVRSRWIGKAVFGVCVAIGTALIFGLTQLGWVEGWLAYVAILVALAVPLAIGQLLYTAHFDFSPWDRRLVFEFRSRDYAEAFEAINEPAKAVLAASE